jgi:ERF superfamily
METQPKRNLFQKLLIIQQRINGLGKDKKAFTYSYVTGDKLLGEIKPIMNDLGVLLKQEVLSIENTRQDYQAKQGAKSEIHSKVMMRFTWIDSETGEKDENLFGANGQNDWDKGVGSALTYGERYFLLKYFHIATDEDDIDNPERKPEEAAKVSNKAQNNGISNPLTILKTEYSNLLNNQLITDPERKQAILKINVFTEEQLTSKIAKLKEVIGEREKQSVKAA